MDFEDTKWLSEGRKERDVEDTKWLSEGVKKGTLMIPNGYQKALK